MQQSTTPTQAEPAGRVSWNAPIALWIGFGLFAVAIVLLLIPPFIKPNVPTFPPTPLGPRVTPRSVVDTLTIDAGDEHRWTFVELDSGKVSVPPDTMGWDLMLKRFHLIPAGAIATTGPAAFDSVSRPPEAGFTPSRFAHDTSNAVTNHWYTYSYFSHLLAPKNELYVVRTRGGAFYKLQILSYYCPGPAGPTPGCVTFRYGRIGG